jgi:hypothetical protein
LCSAAQPPPSSGPDSPPTSQVDPRTTAKVEGPLYAAIVFFAAVLVPDLGTIFSLTGGTSVVCLIFSFPLAFILKLRLMGLPEAQEGLLEGGRNSEGEVKEQALAVSWEDGVPAGWQEVCCPHLCMLTSPHDSLNSK